jgi:hypothetical protein
MTKSITVNNIESDLLHPLYIQYDGEIMPQRAYIELDTRSNTLEADYAVDSSTTQAVLDGTIQQFTISPQLTKSEINDLLDDVKAALQADTDTETIEQLCNERITESQGVFDAVDWCADLSQWYGSQTEEETLNGLLDDTDKKLRNWFSDLGYFSEGDDNRHASFSGYDSATIFGLLDYWRDRVDEYRAEKAEV